MTTILVVVTRSGIRRLRHVSLKPQLKDRSLRRDEKILHVVQDDGEAFSMPGEAFSMPGGAASPNPIQPASAGFVP